MKTAGWRQLPLSALLSIKHGFAFKGEHFGIVGTHIVLTPGNFREEGGFIEKPGKEKWYSGPIPTDYVLPEGALLVAMTEQAEGLLGSSALVPRSGLYLHNQRLGLVQVRDHTLADSRFLYYLFNHQVVRQQIRASASGTKIRHTAPSRIESVIVPVPGIEKQRRIAGILSAYDDLIENSQRRIRILEDMARGLYREWFVNFRFPGADAVPLVDSAAGPIPLGWSVKSIGALARYVNRGIAPAYDEDGMSLVLNQKCIRDRRVSLSPARRQSKGIASDKLIQFGDVLINSTGVGTLGRVAQVLVKVENCTVDTHVTLARPSAEVDLHYFGQMLQALQPEFERLGVGATGQTELSRSAVTGIAVAAAPHELQLRFGGLARGMRLQAVGLAERCGNLRRTRDLLLPRLLSGQISVGEAAEQIQDRTQGAAELADVAIVS